MAKQNNRSTTIRALRTTGTQHLIERVYREGGAYQWVRETLQNSLEAGATRIEYGTDWRAVESHHVYRRVIADNGRGMSPAQLVDYLGTFGGGWKPIGGLAENFGVGAKTSLLPWNPRGVVVLSWVDGIGSMVWLARDASGEYGLRYLPAVDGDGTTTQEIVATPSVEWEALRPRWLTTHGTVLVLLGDSPTADTVRGDPSRAESDLHGVAKYLNSRVWEIPANVTVTVESFRTDDRAQWPRSREAARAARAVNTRTVRGAKHWITYSDGNGSLRGSGTVKLADGVEADWYLWSGERPKVHGYAPELGYIGVLYRGEIYNTQTHHSIYRALGISQSVIRQRLWVLFRPPEYDAQTGHGVFPTTDRNNLKYRGANSGDDLPLSQWANHFAEQLPAEICQALSEARAGDAQSITDSTWRERLAERFGARWRALRMAATDVRPGAAMTPELLKATAHNSTSHERVPTTSGAPPATRGTPPGAVTARPTRVGVSLPYCRAVSGDEFEYPGILAAWQPHDSEYPGGVVLLNRDHVVIQQQIAHYQARYPEHLAEQIDAEVMSVYKEMAVAKVAHSEHMRALLPSHVIDEELRSPEALTMSLLGLVGEDAVIHARLGARLGKTRPAA